MKTKTRKVKKSNGGKIAGIVVGTVAVAVLLGGMAVITKGFTQPPSFTIVQETVDKSKIYTATFATDEAEGTRGNDAVGMVAGINGEKNDFDHAFPYCEMKTVVDEKGNKFTRVPKFYHKLEFGDDGETIYSITGVETEGFTLHPAFIQGEDIIDYFDIGAYEASFTDEEQTGLMSKSGKFPATNITLDDARELAEEDGYFLTDWRQTQAIQELFVVEFATLDAQSIMLGKCEYLDCYEIDEAPSEDAPKTWTVECDEYSIIGYEGDDPDVVTEFITNHNSVRTYYTSDEDDSSFELGEYFIEDFELEETQIVSLTFDREIDISILDMDLQSAIENGTIWFEVNSITNTGKTDGKIGSSVGSATDSIDFKYRGIENWYGSCCTWIDGLATTKEDNLDMVCVSMDARNNSDRDTYERFESTDVIDAINEEGIFIKNAYDVTDDNFYMSSFYSDSYKIASFGGFCNDQLYAGAFYVACNDDVSDLNPYNGFRLSSMPL